MRAISKICALLAMANMLTGCASEPEVKYVPLVKRVTIDPPAECLSDDQDWTSLPDADATRSQVASNYALNNRAYREMQADRAVCRAGLKASHRKKKG